MNIVHEVKTLREFYELGRDIKSFEIRINDRSYDVGDLLLEREISKEGLFTGRKRIGRIVYISQITQVDNHVVMSIKPLEWESRYG